MAGRLAELEAAKKAAVAAEDYDAAKVAKASIDRVRAGAGAAAAPGSGGNGDSARSRRCGYDGMERLGHETRKKYAFKLLTGRGMRQVPALKGLPSHALPSHMHMCRDGEGTERGAPPEVMENPS